MEGDIDALSSRIAQIRTWTFVANRPDWLDDPEHWQGVTRAIEDRLSDALHERLAQRFVDRRTSVLTRRLRENAMLDTEIGKSGEVTVEGHVIGHLHGFEFAPDTAGAGQDAKALRAAAQKVLAGEIEARAKRLAEAPDSAFVLSNDGAIRWVGEAVARLTASESLLEPRLRLLADELLNGAARESVEVRLTLWLKAHVRKLLGPLFELSEAESVTGIARGVAFQLVEALGVLERQKVAEEVKGLDQTTRATLRKFGVRFGAYHIYVPALLKPAPRTLALLLWALKNGGLEQNGIDALPALASSGRTSIAVDPAIANSLYRLTGYRVCGVRAVRVDILERLADLIRPALSWRPNAPGEKPAGAVDGRSFTVAIAMTSLAGCAGEDFAALLRSLGYRMERRPAPAVATAESEAPATASANSNSPAPDASTESTDAPDVSPIEPEPGPQETPSSPAEPSAAGDPIELGMGGIPPEDCEAAAVAPQPQPTEWIEVWRPGRPPGARRPQRGKERGGERDKGRREAPRAEVAVSAANAPAAADAVLPERKEPRRDGARHRKARRGNNAGSPGPRTYKDRPRTESPRERPIDPNSPFAALLELKARLEAERNEKG
jgi:ATP-dependent RNA helicase SUPV3L1/SUV3